MFEELNQDETFNVEGGGIFKKIAGGLAVAAVVSSPLLLYIVATEEPAY